MSEYATIFGSPIAEVQNDLLLSYILGIIPGIILICWLIFCRG